MRIGPDDDIAAYRNARILPFHPRRGGLSAALRIRAAALIGNARA